MPEPERHARITELFLALADAPPAEWHSRLQAVSAGDAVLAAEVLRLLEADRTPAPLLDRELSAVAQELLYTPAPCAPEGLRAGPYRLTRLLGEGGMGVVYLAERDDLGSVAAVKLLRDAWLSPSRRLRFAAEQRLLAGFDHPFIARLLDADTLPDGTPWFAMEYVDGIPITEYCRQQSLGLRGRLELFSAVCEAVLYAHRRAVIHRDLKPSNILAKCDGTVRLLDFGIASTLDDIEEGGSGKDTGRTRTGLRLLTPAWAAPELLRGEPAGVQCDVYALGTILFELLAGRLPAGTQQHLDGAYSPQPGISSSERPSVAASGSTEGAVHATRNEWADLDVLCLTAMHDDLGRRYASVEALLRDLRRFLANRPLEARPDSVAYRTRKCVQRHRGAVLSTVAAALTLLVLVAVFTWRLTNARDHATAEAARAQRVQAFLFQLFSGGDALAGPANDLRVSTLIERGVLEARTLRSDPQMQAELFQHLGGVYQQLGDLSRADELLTEALDRQRVLHGDQHLAVARGRIALALLRIDQAMLDDAETLVRAALSAVAKEVPPGHPDLVRAQTALGSVLIEQGKYDTAMTVLTEAAGSGPGESSGDNPRIQARLLLANAQFYAGDFAASRRTNLAILASQRAALGDRHPAVADIIVNLGAIAHEEGRLQEAMARYREALDITEAWFGDAHPNTASVLTMLGRTLVSDGQLEAAAGALRRALAIQEGVHGSVHPSVASALNELGTVSLQRNDLAEAESSFQRVAAIYRRIHGDDHYLNGIALSNLGSTAMAGGRLSLAEDRYRQALACFSVTLPEEHLNTGIARLKLGRTLLRQKRYGEARVEIEAGRRIVAGTAQPGSPWLAAADGDLKEIENITGGVARRDDAKSP